MTGIPHDCLILYHRQGPNQVRLTLQSVTNRELREVLVGLWARLEPDDRADHIRELHHYQEEDGFLSQAASAISRGVAGENAIDMREVARRYTEELQR